MGKFCPCGTTPSPPNGNANNANQAGGSEAGVTGGAGTGGTGNATATGGTALSGGTGTANGGAAPTSGSGNVPSSGPGSASSTEPPAFSNGSIVIWRKTPADRVPCRVISDPTSIDRLSTQASIEPDKFKYDIKERDGTRTYGVHESRLSHPTSIEIGPFPDP